MGKIRNTAARRWAIRLLCLTGVAPVTLAAQTTNNTNAPTTVTAPTLDHFSLPPGANTQVQPPLVTPTPAATPTPSAPVRTVTPPPVRPTVPAVTPTPTPAARQTPRPSVAPATRPAFPQTVPAASPTPAPAPALVPIAPVDTPTAPAAIPPSPAPADTGASEGGAGYGWLGWGLAGVVLLALAGIAWAMLRQRRRAEIEDDDVLEIADVVPANTSPPPAAIPPALKPKTAAPAQPSAGLSATFAQPSPQIAFRAKRAGLNLTGAAVEYELDIRNPAAQPIHNVRVDIRMLTASEQQDAVLAGMLAEPVQRPVVAPFELAAGGHIELSGMAMMPLDSLVILTMQERRFFVPMVAVRLVYEDAEGVLREAVSVQVIGIDRGPDTRMAPFRTDVPPRMFDTVTQRPHIVQRR